MKRDPYEVLGVGRDAGDAEIKKAFRRLARELHPDVNPDDPAAEGRFKEAAEAYEIVSDPERRATYDRYGHEGLRSGGWEPNFDGFGSLGDLFGALFGQSGGQRGPAGGSDVASALELTLEEAAAGGSFEVAYEVIDRCEHCRGNGAEPGTPIETCERCGGAGRLQAVTRTPFGQMMRTIECDVCGGDGRVPEQPCGVCAGEGSVREARTLHVDIPAGIADGQRIRLGGRGHAGARGGPNGDLYVVVRVREDERFLRDAEDLITVVDVAAPLAALGTTIQVPTLDGDVPVDVPAGTQPGETILLRGRGMPPLGRGRTGDLRVVVNVAIPRRLTSEQRDLLERLSGTLTEDNLRSDEGMFAKIKRALAG